MIRASAKNFPGVIVVVDPADYQPILEKLRKGDISIDERKRLAQKAFQHTAIYDTAISGYLRPKEEIFPADMTMAMHKIQDLSYGENSATLALGYDALHETLDDRERQALLAEQLLHVAPRGEYPLAGPIGPAVHHGVEHLQAVMAHADAVEVGKGQADRAAQAVGRLAHRV